MTSRVLSGQVLNRTVVQFALEVSACFIVYALHEPTWVAVIKNSVKKPSDSGIEASEIQLYLHTSWNCVSSQYTMVQCSIWMPQHINKRSCFQINFIHELTKADVHVYRYYGTVGHYETLE